MHKGMVCEIIDNVFSERQGRYFIDAVGGEFGENGGERTMLGIFNAKQNDIRKY